MKRFLKSCLLVIALVAVGLPAHIWLGSQDPPIDDTDLRVPPLAQAPGQNGRELFEAAVREIWFPAESSAALASLASGGPWDEALAAEFLAKNQPALARIPAILGAPRFQLAPLAWDGETFAVGESDAWPHPARALAIRARAHARAGRQEQAFADALAAVQLGQRLRSAQGATLLAGMLGVASTGTGLGALESALEDFAPDAAQARRWTDALAATRVSPRAWRGIWSVEYQSMVQLMARVGQGEGPETPGVIADPWAKNRYVFKPNATKALFADFYRTLQRGSGGPCNELPLPEVAPPDSSWQRLRAFARPNGVGKILFWVSAPNFVDYELRRCSAETRLEAVRTWIALRAYQAEHDTLPETLRALVPRYLAEIPRDAFDGLPLYYDAAVPALGRERPGVLRDPTRFEAPF